MIRKDLSDPKLVKQLLERARHAATRRGHPELADDFSQELFIRWLSGQSQHQTIDQAFIDYLRGIYGRTGPRGSGSGSGRKPGPKDFVNVDELRNIAQPTNDIEPTRSLAHLFGGRDAFLYQARFVEEMSEHAIAEILGVTESRISQLLKPIAKVIQDAAIIEHARERMEYDEGFGLLSVDWITA